MKTIFGVNSATPINKKLKNGYTMYDWVKRQKCFPAFCMRTISGEDKITAEEIEFLKSPFYLQYSKNFSAEIKMSAKEKADNSFSCKKILELY